MGEKPGISKAALDHMAGVGVVSRHQFGDKVYTRLLAENSLESALWRDVAFTNGPPLRRIVLEYSPEEAAEIAEKGQGA